MNACELHQAQLLEYLYDLLEPADRAGLEAHLRDCPACQAAHAQALGQKHLLAAAAKLEFADVRFQVPPAEAPVTLAFQVRRPRRRWVGWVAAAAAVLLLATPAAWFGSDYQKAGGVVHEHQVALDQLRGEAQDVDHQVAMRVPQERGRKLAELERQVAERQTRLVVSGPKSVEPGAANVYLVHTENLLGEPAPARLTARVRDQAQKVVFEQKDIDSPGEARVVLPPSLPLKPGARLTLDVVARRDGAPESEVLQQLDLAAPVYVTHLATDKPMYLPGETVRYRSLTLERFSLKPAEENFHFVYTLQAPSGAAVEVGRGQPLLQREKPAGNWSVVVGPDGKPLRGVGAGEFALDPESPGGEYVLTVSDAFNRFPPQQRKFLVNHYRKPRLNKKLDFGKKTYGPGETVTAACEAETAERKPVAGRPVQVWVKIDGVLYGADGKPSPNPIPFSTDNAGKVVIRFQLPAVIDKGDATVTVLFEDQGSPESMVRPIPLVLKKLDVKFFAEGGDLVAGVEDRVYFQVRTPLGKPAELKGCVLEDGTKEVALAETLNDDKEPGVNQGLGMFTFTPEAGKKYALRIDSPAGIDAAIPLPDVKPAGVVLSIQPGVIAAKAPIRAVVRSAGADRKLLVGAYCRGRLIDHKPVTVKAGEAATIDLQPVAGTGGVYRVTAFEERQAGGRRDLVPVAERLVYRAPAEHLLLTMKPDKKLYVPGDHVKLALAALNDKDQPTPAVLMVAVVDKSVITLADEKTARGMPTHFLLTSEVEKPEDLEYADFFLGTHPKAAQTLDLLLGTQGWRRFKEQDPARLQQPPQGEAERLVLAEGQSPPPVEFARAEHEKIEAGFQAEMTRLRHRQDELMQQGKDLAIDPAYLAAAAKMGEYKLLAQTARTTVAPLAALGLLVLALAGIIAALVRSRSRGVLLYVGSAACTLLAVGLFVASRDWDQEQSRAAMASRIADGDKDQPDPARDERFDAHKADMAQIAPRPEAPIAPPDDGRAAEHKVMAAKPEGAAGAMPAPAAPGGVGGPMPGAPVPAQGGQGQGFQGGFGGGPLGGPIRNALPMQLGRAQDAEKKKLEGLEEQLRARAGAGGEGDKADLAKLRMPAGDLKEARDRAQQFRRLQQMGADGKDKKPADFRFGGMAGKREMGLEAESAMPLPPPLVIREYAHARSPGDLDRRHDFTETVYWQPVLVLPGGKGDVAFDLSDNTTAFQVTTFAHTLDGRLGALTGFFESRLPLTLEPRLPIEVTANDKIDLPLAVGNNTDALRQVQLKASFQNLKLLEGEADRRVDVPADKRTRRIYRLQPSLVEGEAQVQFEGVAQPFAADKVEGRFKIVPDGFPVLASKSDLLEGAAGNDLVLPENWIPGTLKCQVNVYPSTLADLQKGLDGLLQEPYGCFEQTSTTNYPNLLILDYLKESDQARPQVEKRARELLARGYQRLTSFECPKSGAKERQGYEWFGSPDQAHEALTAYGLLQFRDLARVQNVDQAMIRRTANYLLAQRDGKGGFKRNARALDTFGRAPEDITNAYIVWALTESGPEDDISAELNSLAEQAKNSKDAYFLALVANSLINRGKTDEARVLLRKLAEAQKEDGHLDAERTSITGSGGRDLQVETTALAVLAWLKANPGEFNAPVQKAVKWIGQQRGGQGAFGSTQSTILALKALIQFTKANKKTPEAGTLSLFVGETRVASLDFPAGARDALELPLHDAEKHLKAGKNRVRVELSGKNAFPYTLAWSYRTLQPLSADDCPVRLTTKLEKSKAGEGETVTLNVTVENPSADERSMVVAIVGLPAGLTVPEDMKQLKEHVALRENGTKPGRISYFETRGRELILYWRGMGPKQKVEVPVELICRLPGEYRGPASRAYLYYNADRKHWVEPLQVTITPKME